jgi:hypothetical protein
MTVVGADVREGVDYTGFDWCRPVAVVFGNEASGLDTVARDALDGCVSIRMEGRAESLNVSVSAAVLAFEALRQRRDRGDLPVRSRESGGVRPTMPGMGSTATGHGQGGGGAVP